MSCKTIKHSDVEREFSQNELESFYNKVKEERLEYLYEDPDGDDWDDLLRYELDDKGNPVPQSFAKRAEQIQRKKRSSVY